MKETGDFINCKSCGEEFFTNKRLQLFCCSDCKNDYHNSQNKEDYQLRKEIAPIVDTTNALLIKNRNILAAHLDRQIERVELEKLGFNFRAITGYSQSEDQSKVTFLCYDMAYYPVGKVAVKIKLSKNL